MNIEVSQVEESDKEVRETLYREYADFYKMPVEKSTLDTVWKWIQSDGEEFFCIVARDQNKEPVGFMHYRSMPSPLRGCKVGFLDDLYVAPDSRGTGVVEALFKALDIKAQEQGWPFVRWLTADDNVRAQAVYRKLSDRTKWVTYQLNAGTVV
ncbi:GNAT family N-acetyltransferase [Thalassolituus oleivorans]|uniref:GNAT family N-acetyltransferase n=1 Tax=Thalassolituus oleivorans TaxID=187493 RepID=UPI000949478E|nr:GNAT family N-acetyltransferase [Thalassolituus oleivorans]APR66768.1 GNAT family N-acetyltransferase [Thalassolituus oleivorans]